MYEDKEGFVRRIWSEKREKIVSDKICDLGVSITVDNLDFDWHAIVYGLLSLLRSDVEKAYCWSKNWGRTVIQVHPNKPFSFHFTLLESFEERSGVFLSTALRVDPADFLNHENNIGAFEILLNKQHLLFEGAILQVERMVDELVWCRYLFLKDRESYERGGERDEELYGKALDDVWFYGVRIRYVSESALMDMKQKNPDLPVRIYGDFLKKGTVPLIIGAVGDLTKEKEVTDRDEISRVKRRISERSSRLVEAPELSALTGGGFAGCMGEFVVCSAITVAKKIHVGHLLLVSYAELVSKVLNGGQGSIWIECNDVGERIFGTVAALAVQFGINAAEIVSLLSAGKIPIDDIDGCYRGRIMSGDVYNEAVSALSGAKTDILCSMREYTKLWLERYGFGTVRMVSDSECLPEYHGCISPLNKSDLSELGFSFARYWHKGNRRMCVLERQAIPTAPSMRGAFVLRLLSSVPRGVTPIFVDAGLDVVAAKDLVSLTGERSFVRMEGVGLGYGMRIMSGSGGGALLVEDLFRFLSGNSVFGGDPVKLKRVMMLFVLTRFMTAKAYKKDTAIRGRRVDVPFYDYSDEYAFKADLIRCFEEFGVFCRMVSELRTRICEVEDSSMDEENVLEFSECSYKQKELEGFFRHFECLPTLVNINILFPRPKIVGLDLSFCEVRRLVLAKEDMDISVANGYILDALLDGMSTLGDVARHLRKNGLKLASIASSRSEGKVFCSFVDNLFHRGYSTDQLREIALSYLKGDHVLLKKRCVFFEDLEKMNGMIEFLSRIGSVKARALLNSVSFCMERLGLEDTVVEVRS